MEEKSLAATNIRSHHTPCDVTRSPEQEEGCTWPAARLREGPALGASTPGPGGQRRHPSPQLPAPSAKARCTSPELPQGDHERLSIYRPMGQGPPTY